MMSEGVEHNLSLVEKIANAVLYEGYILYPYRPSAVKNQQRWNFGALTPHSYSLAQSGTDAWSMQTECLIKGSERTALDVKARFLHLLAREVCEVVNSPPEVLPLRVIASLEVGSQIYQTWQEAVEREINVPALNLGKLVVAAHRQTFAFPSSQATESLRDADDKIVGVIVRRQEHIEGVIEVTAELIEHQLFKITVRISNLTPFAEANAKSRDEALMRSTVSTHTILGAREGEFVSLLDPPAGLREAAALCRNTGTYPVLIGEEGARDCVLSSPIILYDYPQIAPESAGDFFDGTEIDEMLTLRIMTLTDEEKREMRGGDEHARRILERTETLPADHLMKLHGAVRGLRPLREDER